MSAAADDRLEEILGDLRDLVVATIDREFDAAAERLKDGLTAAIERGMEAGAEEAAEEVALQLEVAIERAIARVEAGLPADGGRMH